MPRIESIPSRSSIHPGFGALAWSTDTKTSLKNSGVPRNDHFLRPEVHGVLIEWFRRRPGNNVAVEIVISVVAGAPDLPLFFVELNGAVEMGADCRKGLKFGVAYPHQK